MPNQKENKSPFLKTIIISLFATLACVGIIKAATTVGANISTTGTLTVGDNAIFSTASSTGIVKFAEINSDTGAISFGDENLSTTGTLNITGLTTLGNASTTQLSVSSNSYLTNTDIYQGNLDLDNTTNANQYGVITKNGTRFIHNFNYGNNGTVTTLGYNTFIGEDAGNLTMGSTATDIYQSSYNTGIGVSSLRSNTTGKFNTAIGVSSLRSNTTGYYNTASGFYSLLSNTTGYFNTANGVESLSANTTGYYNAANGTKSLSSNTTGYANTAIGGASLYSNTTGYYNTASGVNSLYFNTTGFSNTANGLGSLYSNTTGNDNTANGVDSLYSNTTGNDNIAIGFSAGEYIADGVTVNTTGDYNVFLGSGTKALADNDQNEIVIGYNTTGLGSNSVVLGNSNITKTALRGSVGIGTTTPSSLFTIDAGSTATTTAEFGDQYSSSSKVCHNTKNTAGGNISFYFVGTTMIVENNRCQ